MTSIPYSVRPISDRTAFTGPPATGNRNPFEASWSQTVDLLDRELFHLGARDVVLEVDVREQDIRIDGQLRANARAHATPGVRLAFESRHGALVYATDRYGWSYNNCAYTDGWQQNVRAIALGMEALRKVDRYGITKRGEQYRGFKAIGDGSTQSSHSLAVTAARALIDGYGGVAAALRATHPDHGGNVDDFRRVQEARRLIEAGS